MSIFSIFAQNDQTAVLSTEVTTGLWSPDETGSLSAVFTSSIQKDIAGEYFYDLYNLNPSVTSNNAEVQFSVAYGHVDGGGSPILDTNVLGGQSVLPTQVIYSQYRNILLTSGSKFTFNQTASNDIYVINVNRARMKQALDPGNRYAHRLAIELECALLAPEQANADLLDEYHTAVREWMEANGQPYVSGFGKD